MAQIPRPRKRIPFCVSLPPEIIRDLGKIDGNRSAAIEKLVRDYYARRAAAAALAPA
jgi:hypothetical protein